MELVVAAFGNVLRTDDGFGVEVLQALQEEGLPVGVTGMDVGIGGIHLVQHLLAEPTDALVVLDAVDLPRPPGTVLVVEPDVEDLDDLPVMARRDHLADMHYATPDRALMLARAMGVLPPVTRTIGCVPVDADTPGMGLTPTIARAVPVAAAEVRRVARELGLAWPDP